MMRACKAISVMLYLFSAMAMAVMGLVCVVAISAALAFSSLEQWMSDKGDPRGSPIP